MSIDVCVWEVNHVYLPVEKAISLEVTIRLIGVIKDRTLHFKDKVLTDRSSLHRGKMLKVLE